MEPRPPPHRSTAARRSTWLPALHGRDPTAAYLFYDCQTDDARLVLTVLGEAERFGAVCANRCRGHGADRARTSAPPAFWSRDTEGGGEFELTAANVVNATGVWADRMRPDELLRSRGCRASGPAAAPTSRSPRPLPVNAGAIVPAGSGRSIFVAALARPHADRHDRQRLRGAARPHPPPAPTTSSTCSRRSTSSSAPTLGARTTSPAPTRAYGR